MKLLLDTNVLVAALVARGVCADLLEHCVREHELVTSAPLMDELRDVLTRKFHQSDRDVNQATQLFLQRFTLATPVTLEQPACRDIDDDVVLGTALGGGCSAVITGDQDLLVLDPFRGVRILSPSSFWQWESEQAPP